MAEKLVDRPKIDKIDVIILKALLKDARTHYADIAKECGISSNSIKLRINRLKKEGVIIHEVTQVNPKGLGYNCIAFLPIQACTNKIQDVCDFLKNSPNRIDVMRDLGKFNILMTVTLKNIEDIDNVIAYVKGNPDVIEVYANIAWDLVRVDHPENLEIEEYEGN